MEKGAPKSFAKFTGKYLFQSHFLINLLPAVDCFWLESICFSGSLTKCKIHKLYNLIYPLGIGRKLNAHKTFRRRPGRLPNILCTFKWHHVSMGIGPCQKSMIELFEKVFNGF